MNLCVFIFSPTKQTKLFLNTYANLDIKKFIINLINLSS